MDSLNHHLVNLIYPLYKELILSLMEQGLGTNKQESPSQNNHNNTENSKWSINVPGKANQKVEEGTSASKTGKSSSPQFKNIFARHSTN